MRVLNEYNSLRKKVDVIIHKREKNNDNSDTLIILAIARFIICP